MAIESGCAIHVVAGMRRIVALFRDTGGLKSVRVNLVG